jgi:hypothetical protein
MPPAVGKSYINTMEIAEMQLQAIDCEHIIFLGTKLAAHAAQFQNNH